MKYLLLCIIFRGLSSGLISQVPETTLDIHALLQYQLAMECFDSDHVPNTQGDFHWELLSGLAIELQQSLSHTYFLSSLPKEAAQTRKSVASRIDRYLVGETSPSD